MVRRGVSGCGRRVQCFDAGHGGQVFRWVDVGVRVRDREGVLLVRPCVSGE